MHYCFMNNIRLSDTELGCLSLLGKLGPIRLSEFSKIASGQEGGHILGSSIAITSCLSKIERTGLIQKQNKGKIIISLNPKLGIHSNGTIMINLKLIKYESTNTAPGNIQKNSTTLEPV